MLIVKGWWLSWRTASRKSQWRWTVRKESSAFAFAGCRNPTGWLFLSSRLPWMLASDEAAMRQTVQELMQEREITYRNLLAAYLRLQEVNRQKTVFLASAAHELKTPLAVMKGYYDLLLSGSLGKINERQRDTLMESKESCDRLVRLVSMFLNYSALESGKLVLAAARERFARLRERHRRAAGRRHSSARK